MLLYLLPLYVYVTLYLYFYLYITLYLTLYLFLAFFLILTLSLSLGDKRVTVGRHCHPFFPFMGEADAPARECSMCSSADLLHQTCIQKEKLFRLESSGL